MPSSVISRHSSTMQSVPLGRPGSSLSEAVPSSGLDIPPVEQIPLEQFIPPHILYEDENRIEDEDGEDLGGLGDILTSIFTDLYTPPPSPKPVEEVKEPEPEEEEIEEPVPEKKGKKGKGGKSGKGAPKKEEKPKKPEKEKKGSKKGPGEVTAVQVSIDNPVATQESAYTFNFQTTSEVPGNGAIIISFPEGVFTLDAPDPSAEEAGHATGAQAHEATVGVSSRPSTRAKSEGGVTIVETTSQSAVQNVDTQAQGAVTATAETESVDPEQAAAEVTPPSPRTATVVARVAPVTVDDDADGTVGDSEAGALDATTATASGDEVGPAVGTVFTVIIVDGHTIQLTRPAPSVEEEDAAENAEGKSSGDKAGSRPSSKKGKKGGDDKKKKGGGKAKVDPGPPLLPASASLAGGIRITRLLNPTATGPCPGEFSVRTVGGDGKVIDQSQPIALPESLVFAAPPPPRDEYTDLIEQVQRERDSQVQAVNELEAYILQRRQEAQEQQERDEAEADMQFTELRRQTGVPVPRTRFSLEAAKVQQFGLLNLKSLLDRHNEEFTKSLVLRENQVRNVDVLTKLTAMPSQGTLDSNQDANTTVKFAAVTESVKQPPKSDPLDLTAPIIFAEKGPEVEARKKAERQAKLDAKMAKIRAETMLPKEREKERIHLEKMRVKADFLKNPRHTAERGVPTFRVEPERVSWGEYQVGHIYEEVVTIRNVSKISHRVRVLPPATPFFSVSPVRYPRGDSLIAPGCICQVTISFAPNSLGDFHDEIVLEDDGGVISTLELTAARPPPRLSIGSEWDCGAGLVGSMTVVHFSVTNHGGSGSFCLFPAAGDSTSQVVHTDDGDIFQAGAFTVRPASCDIPKGHTEEFIVEFAPTEVGDIVQPFRLACDNLRTLPCQLVAEATASTISISQVNGNPVDAGEQPKSLGFGSTSVNARIHKTVTLHNPTGVALPYVWDLYRMKGDTQPLTLPERDANIDLNALELEPRPPVPDMGGASPRGSDDASLSQASMSRGASQHGAYSSVGSQGDKASDNSVHEQEEEEGRVSAMGDDDDDGDVDSHGEVSVGKGSDAIHRPFVISPCGGMIEPGDSVDIVFTFEPDRVHNYSYLANLVVGDLEDSPGSQRRHEQQLVLRGSGQADRLTVDTPLVSFPGHLLAGQLYRRVFHVYNQGRADVAYDWKLLSQTPLPEEDNHGLNDTVRSNVSDLAASSGSHLSARQLIEVQPATGVIHRDATLELELVVRAAQPGPLRACLSCHVANGPPVYINVQAEVRGPEVRIIDPEVAFGLVLIGSTVEHPLCIENLSEGHANWSIRLHDTPELTTQIRDEFHITPSDGILSPFHSEELSISYRPSHASHVDQVLELHVEGCDTPEYVRLTATARAAHVCLNRLSVDFGVTYVDVPSVQVVTLKNLTLFATPFAWDVQAMQSDRYTLTCEPSSGVVDPRGYTEVKFTLVPHFTGDISTVIPCDVQGMDMPLGFELQAAVKGFEVQYSLEPEHSDQKAVKSSSVSLDFGDDVDIFDTKSLTFHVHNLSANESPFEFSFMRFGAPAPGDVDDPVLNATLTAVQTARSMVETARTGSKPPTARAAPLTAASMAQQQINAGVASAATGPASSRGSARGGLMPQSARAKKQAASRQGRPVSRASIASRLSMGGAPSLGGGGGMNATVNSIAGGAAPSVILSRTGTPSVRPVGVSARLLATQQAQVDTEAVERAAIVQQRLSAGDGVAFHVEPSFGMLGPYEEIEVTVTLYNDMYGSYTDYLVCQYPGMETHYLPVSAGVVGSPLFIAPNSLGLTLRTTPPSVNCGTLNANSEPVTRAVTIGNKAPCDVEIDWRTINHTGQHVTLDLSVVEETGRVSLHLAERPLEESDHPFLVHPKVLRVPAKGSDVVTITYHPSPTAGPYLAALLGRHVNFASEERPGTAGTDDEHGRGRPDPSKSHELDKAGSHLEIDLLGRITEPRLTMDKKSRLHFKIPSSAQADDPTCVRTFNLTNATEAPMSFYLSSDDPDLFEIVHMQSSADKRPRAAQIRDVQTQKFLQTQGGMNGTSGVTSAHFPPGAQVISLQPRDNASVTVKTHIPSNIADILDESDQGSTILTSQLIARYMLGAEQAFPLQATFFAPHVTATPAQIAFGTRLVRNRYTATFVIANPTLADAHWRLTHVAASSRLHLGNVEDSSANTTPDASDDPGVFTFEPASGSIAGHGGLQPKTATVVVAFTPKKALDYECVFEISCKNGVQPCRVTISGRGGFEETLAPPRGAVIHGRVGGGYDTVSSS